MSEVKANPRPRVVIVGGGFGGIAAARALRRADADVAIVDRENYFVFQPLLYQVATAGLSPANIAVPIRRFFRHQSRVRVVMGEVTAVNTASQEVLVRDLVGHRALPYDFLVIAAGARHSYFSHPEWERWAPGLKTIDDAMGIRRRILLAFEEAELTDTPEERTALLTFVVVGAGPTGVELAGAVAELAKTALRSDFRRMDPSSARVLLVEAGDRVLPSFPTDLSARAQRSLARLGVDVRTGTPAELVDEAGVVAGGVRIAARTVIWAAGVAASEAGSWLGVPTDKAGRIVIKPDLTIERLPTVYVVGDTALGHDAKGAPLPGIAPVAMQMGWYAGKAIAARIAGRPLSKSFHYRDKGNVATIGRASAVAAMGRFHLSGFIAWSAWVCVHIWYLISFRNRVMVMLEWIWAYFTYERGARLIIRGGRPSD